MNCQTCDERLSDYIDGGITPAERIAIEAHLASCPDCAAQRQMQLSMLESLRSWTVEKAPANAWMRFEDAMDLEDAMAQEGDLSRVPYLGSPRVSIGAILASVDASVDQDGGQDSRQGAGGALQALYQLWRSWQAWAMPLAVAALVLVALRSSSMPSGAVVAPAPVVAIAPARRTTPPSRRKVKSPPPVPGQRAVALRQVEPPAQERAVALRQVEPLTRRRMARHKRPGAHRRMAQYQRVVPRHHHPAVMAALHSLAMAQQQYQRALSSLEQVARQKLLRKQAAPRNRHLLRLLARIDHSIAEARQIISRQPDATQTHRILVAMYQRKVEILRDVILDD